MSKKSGKTITKKILPPTALRVTKIDGSRVWLIGGKEYLSKREWFEHLLSLQKRAKDLAEKEKQKKALKAEDQKKS